MKIARYTVIIDRAIPDEDATDENVTPKEAVKQLADELQEGYDVAGIGGNFQIVKREIIDNSAPTCFSLPTDFQ